jgi:tRNA dimethylallyltransferase
VTHTRGFRLKPGGGFGVPQGPAERGLSVSGGVIAIFGPTASGKSAVAAALARRIPAEVVSADAMQLYRGLPILTNQSEPPERLVAIWPLDHEGSVGEYAALAHREIDAILAAGRTPVVVGGTGLYLRAALAELCLPPALPPGERERWERLYDEEGPLAAQAELRRRDPRAAERVHPNDRRRVVRALELAAVGASLVPDRDRLWTASTRHPTLVVGLDVLPAELARRIEERTRAMFERGVVAEVRSALATGRLSRTAEKTLGLRELAELDAEAARERIVVRTRRYAAYQRKWMRRIRGIVIIDGDRPPEEVADAILEVARARELVPRR